MKRLIGALLAALDGGSRARPRRRPITRAAGRATLDSSTPTDPIDERMETRMQE